jgi:hypothetical protein
MTNENIRESKQALKSLNDVLGKIVKPHTVFSCIVCEQTKDHKDELITHMITNHTLNQIFTVVDFDEDFRNL